jgi:hypothetical protein
MTAMSDANNLTFPVPSKIISEKIGATTIVTGVAIGTDMPIDAGDGYAHEAQHGTPGQEVVTVLPNGTVVTSWSNP